MMSMDAALSQLRHDQARTGSARCKEPSGFDVDQARSDDKRALWTCTLVDAQGATAVVRQEDRLRMIPDGLSEADIEAVERHLTMVQMNGLVPTSIISCDK